MASVPSLVDDFEVAHVADDVVLEQDAVAAEQVAGFGDDLAGLAGVVELCEPAMVSVSRRAGRDEHPAGVLGMHGSDSVALQTSARRDGDEWAFTAPSAWIGNGPIADVIVVWHAPTRTTRSGTSLVEQDTHGLEAVTMVGNGAARAIWQADIRLDDVHVPDASRLPGAERFKC